MLRPTYGVLIALAASACGTTYNDVAEDKPTHKAHSVNTWQGSEMLKKNKQTLVQTAQSLGADDARVSLLLACFMQETQELLASQRDASKDNTPSANWSAINMNSWSLSTIGYEQSKWAALNDDANLAEAVRVFNTGLDKLGEMDMLCGHRGGQTAANDHCSYGAQAYVSQMRETQSYLLAHKELWTTGDRIGADVPHV